MVSLVTNTNPEGPFPICLKTDQRNWLLGVHRDLRTHNHYRLSYWVTLVNTLLQMSVLLCLPTMVHKKRALTLLALLFSCFFFLKKKHSFFFTCMSVLPTCMLFTMSAHGQNPRLLDPWYWSSSYELHCGCWESNPSSEWAAQVKFH